MQESLFVVYYSCLVLNVVIGSIRYKDLDSAMRILVLLLFTIAICEFMAFMLYKTQHYSYRPVVYHFSCVFRIMLVTTYFIKLLQPSGGARLIVINIFFWLVIGSLNIIFLQPLHVLNTNMVMLECFSVITMSLYSVYWMVKNDRQEAIFINAHFWIAVLWLVLFSSTFFFWAFIKILYKNHWSYMNIVLCLQGVVNIIVYSGIAFVLFFYPKKMKVIEDH